MNTKFYVTKATAILAIASLAFTVATTSIAFGAINLPNSNVSQTGVLTGGGGGGLPPEEPGYPPRNPIITGPVSRTTTALTVRLIDKSLYEQGYELYRGPSQNGPWTVVAFLNPFTGQFDFPDSGLSPDTQYCYRLRAFNAFGESFSSGNCFSTLDGRSVRRVQLRLVTANVEDAGTNDSVRVQLNGPNLTWVDYGRDDFERNDDFTYDLLLDGVSDLADINAIYIHKEGTDGWCLKSLALLVNSKEENPIEIYNQDFGSTAAGCQWIDKASGQNEYYNVSRSTLRAHPLWQNFQQPPLQNALGMLRHELESRIESLVGDQLHGTDAHWGDLDGEGYVEVSKKDDQAVHVTLDLVAEVPLTRDPEVNLSFDLRFAGSCTDGQTPLQLHITAENVDPHADADWWEEVGTFWINFLEDDVEKAVKDAFSNLERTISLNPGQPLCITPQVAGSGALSLLPSTPPSTPKPPTRTGSTTGTITGGTKTPRTGTTGTVGTISTKVLAK